MIEFEDEISAMLPKSDMTRRGFIVNSLAAGFAAAVMPVSAQAISTDEAGLSAGTIKITTADGEIPAYHAQPAGKSKLPVILVVQEIFGVHEHIRDVCRRLAKLGYLAIAPELYARQGDVSKITDIGKIISEVAAKVPDAQVMSDLDASVAWAAKNGGDIDKLAITGFCWGGRIVWMYSAHNPQVKAGAAWYGRLLAGFNPALSPTSPIDVTGQLNAPVLGLYGGKDEGIPLDSVEQMKAKLKTGSAAAKESEFIIYPEAGHAFMADYRPSYRKEAAEDGWVKMLAWFKKYHVA